MDRRIPNEVLPHIEVKHPEYGDGLITSVVLNPDFYRSQEEPCSQYLVFIRWENSQRTGVAGGWYDLTDERFTVEDLVGLSRHAFKLIAQVSGDLS